MSVRSVTGSAGFLAARSMPFPSNVTSRSAADARGASDTRPLSLAAPETPMTSSVSAESEPASAMSASMPSSAASPFAFHCPTMANGALAESVASPVIAPSGATNDTAVTLCPPVPPS